MPSSDKLIYAIADDINRYSRDKYERILVELELYDLQQLHDVEEGYAKILLKKEFIRTTLEEKGIEVLIDALNENSMLSPKTIKLLQEDGYELLDEKKTDTLEQEDLSDVPSQKTTTVQTKAPSKTGGFSNNSPKKSGVKKRASSTLKVSTAITVAMIGCAGTVAAALLVALFGYFGNKSQVEIPIRATQTAEALREDLTANAPTEVVPTEVLFTATPSIDWSVVLKSSSSFPFPCGSKVVPEYVSLDPKNMQLSLANFDTEFLKDVGKDWDGGIGSVLNLYLESYSQLNWIKVENRFNVHVFVESEVPDNINIVDISGCGGGSARELGDIELINQTNMREYRISLNSPDVDFFTLQPGEFELFHIPLICKAPGIYSFAIEINADYQDNSDSFTITPSKKMYCPYSFNQYESFSGVLQFVGGFTWNGSEYKLIP